MPPCDFSTQLSLLSPPVPVSAIYSVGLATIIVAFDSPLVDGPVTFTDFLASDEDGFTLDLSGGGSVSSGNLYLSATPTLTPAVALLAISYFAVFAELVGTNSLPVAAFVDFPMTQIP